LLRTFSTRRVLPSEIAELAAFFMNISFFDPEDGGDMLIFDGLHGVISQEIGLFITTTENFKSYNLYMIQSLNPVDYFPAFSFRVVSTWERNQCQVHNFG
jgi:hypothetical protein